MTTTHIFLSMFATMMIPAVINRVTSTVVKRRGRTVAIAVVIIGAMFLPIVTKTNAIAIGTIILLTIAINAAIMTSIRNGNLARTITMPINILIAVFALGNPSIVSGFNRAFVAVMDALGRNPLFQTLRLDQFHMVVVALAGTYLATIESNHAIALMLKGANLMPSSPAPGDGPENGEIDEPARGRFIGYLERMIVFLLVLFGEVNAIGFVLVAKGIARFQQLDDRAFAEYFLIGTLMSIAMAAVVGIVFAEFL
jgi:hypothetical protein